MNRPDYRSLSSLKRTFPNVPIMALTATATERVQKDIMRFLQARSFCDIGMCRVALEFFTSCGHVTIPLHRVATSQSLYIVWPRHNPLQIPSCYMFKQTFNRPNLRYTVLPTDSEFVTRMTRQSHVSQVQSKPKDCIKQIAAEIRQVDCWRLLCFSQRFCR
jgi:superfamily II DNA helicase RecQ